MYQLVLLCFRDALIVGTGNALTSIYGGIVIFSVLGYMADMKGVGVDDVTARGKLEHFRIKLQTWGFEHSFPINIIHKIIHS